jgi:hypothetical protein
MFEKFKTLESVNGVTLIESNRDYGTSSLLNDFWITTFGNEFFWFFVHKNISTFPHEIVNKYKKNTFFEFF